MKIIIDLLAIIAIMLIIIISIIVLRIVGLFKGFLDSKKYGTMFLQEIIKDGRVTICEVTTTETIKDKEK